MKRLTMLWRLTLLMALFSLVALPASSLRAQRSTTIAGTFYQGFHPTGSQDLSFDPNGGPVAITTDTWRIFGGVCYNVMTLEMEGTFAGGDGGVVSGTFVESFAIDYSSCSAHDDGSGPQLYPGTWTGNFYANGTGSGTLTDTSTGETSTWSAEYSAADFQAALGGIGAVQSTSITPAYILATYGIQVQDEPGSGGYAAKAWTPHELALLDNLLKGLPRSFLNKIALNRIVRNAADLDSSGNPDPGVYGSYWACDPIADPKCTGSSSTIRIYDQALKPSDFSDDPNGETEFVGSLLHEMTHAAIAFNNGNSVNTNGYDSAILQKYMDSTGGGWLMSNNRWYFLGENDNQPPTDYGRTNPKEDLCESAMMYMYDPQNLKNKSAARYNFIRDEIFGGVEYENGKKLSP